MTTSQQIEMAIAYNHKTKASLAAEMDMTRQNFYSKLKRDTFTRDELIKIAELLGGKYVVYFEFPDGTKI